ncbi:YfcE family phosphodiesterase [Virgibacillus phasianinus]|uniref:Phosphoesterase n=1 Tax=Virgibacillus phasianinus TaxID=2017483 RepID=A0A220U848_9BACI|nr:metallophosphoesterase family protein [Virgibacillus phasianinus]ASK64041.1 YfcE family phosphodiesterase [Virgibacillus phasianinus]
MKIVVTSDTHMPKKAKQLPSNLVKDCKSADLIIHAGDWMSMDVFRTFSSYAEVKGVYGNVDPDEVIKNFPSQQIVEVQGHRIGIVHGHGEKKTTEKRALATFDGDEVDIIIYGHSHIPMIRYFKKILLMNPGSPTDKRTLPHYSYGILEIGETVRAEIILFK